MIAADVKPERVRWLLYPHIPLGKLTLLAGKPGQGKSLATTWLAAAVTTGRGVSGQAGRVVMFSAEDDPADTIRPRLEAAGADLSRVWLEPTVSLVDVVRGRCNETDVPPVRLVTIDPIASYLPAGVNAWKSQDVRRALDPLRKLAAERGFAVLIIQHLNRKKDGDALERIADSQGIAQLCRSVLLWGPDPADPKGDDGTQKVLTRGKGNLAPAGRSAAFSIRIREVGDVGRHPYLHREADGAVSADDIVADAETRSAIGEAMDLLRTELSAGPVSSAAVIAKAKAAEISDTTLKRARKRLGVVAEQRHDGEKIAGWVWSIPEKETDPLDHVDPLGQEAKETKKVSDHEASTRPRSAPAPAGRGGRGGELLQLGAIARASGGRS